MPAITIDPKGYLDSIPRGVFRPEDVLRELISNSIQACDLAQQLDHDMKPLIRVRPPSHGRIVVEDNGVGFHPDVLNQLGNFQVSKWQIAEDRLKLRTTDRNRGNVFGMGLTSTYQIASQVEVQTTYARDDTRTIRRWWTNWKDWFTWSGNRKLEGGQNLPLRNPLAVTDRV
ncbi:MAG: ATP-binding protein [Chloroflexi bacterium]|nr:ATP-binding protein [Chloroflexota bacterium]